MGKIYCSIAFLFFSFSSSAQSADTTFKDTSKRFTIIDLRPVNKHDKPLYVVDGIIFKRNIRRINPDDILQVAILKPPGSVNIYGKAGGNGIVIIETLAFGIEYCQRKLSNFSIAYKNYLDTNKNDDSGLVYLLNGVVLEGDKSDIIKKLYDKIEKVKTVDFIDKFSEKLNLNNPKPIVVITTIK